MHSSTPDRPGRSQHGRSCETFTPMPATNWRFMAHRCGPRPGDRSLPPHRRCHAPAQRELPRALQDRPRRQILARCTPAKDAPRSAPILGESSAPCESASTTYRSNCRPKPLGPTEIKKFEDALDAVVCAWIGTRYIEVKMSILWRRDCVQSGYPNGKRPTCHCAATHWILAPDANSPLVSIAYAMAQTDCRLYFLQISAQRVARFCAALRNR